MAHLLTSTDLQYLSRWMSCQLNYSCWWNNVDIVRQSTNQPICATAGHRFSQGLNHQSTNFLISVHKPTTSEFWCDSCSVCLLLNCQHCLSIARSSWKLVTYDRQSVVLASSCLAVQFLLVRMTVSTETCPSIHVVYTDDVPHQPHHIRCWQHDQQLLSLASRRFCVVLANQRLVVATRDNVCSERCQMIVSLQEL